MDTSVDVRVIRVIRVISFILYINDAADDWMYVDLLGRRSVS